jgi:hypothetical protein
MYRFRLDMLLHAVASWSSPGHAQALRTAMFSYTPPHASPQQRPYNLYNSNNSPSGNNQQQSAPTQQQQQQQQQQQRTPGAQQYGGGQGGRPSPAAAPWSPPAVASKPSPQPPATPPPQQQAEGLKPAAMTPETGQWAAKRPLTRLGC